MNNDNVSAFTLGRISEEKREHDVDMDDSIEINFDTVNAMNQDEENGVGFVWDYH